MHTIKCSDLTDEKCDFVVEGETKEKVKMNFFQHGALSSIHQEKYNSATDEQKVTFGKKVDEYLATQE